MTGNHAVITMKTTTAMTMPVLGPNTLPPPPVPPFVPEFPSVVVVPPVSMTCPVRAHFWMLVNSPADDTAV